MPHFETITNNLKSVSNDLAESGKIAREQPLHVQRLVTETHNSIRDQINEVRDRVLETVDEAREVVMPPLRQYSAMATAVAEGVRTFFKRREKGRERAAPEMPQAQQCEQDHDDDHGGAAKRDKNDVGQEDNREAGEKRRFRPRAAPLDADALAGLRATRPEEPRGRVAGVARGRATGSTPKAT